jgi:hypothetical protein
MGYVSTCCGLGWVRHDVKEGRKGGREGVDKKHSNFSHARTFLDECLVCDGCIVHVTPRTAVAKNPLTQRKKTEIKKKESERTKYEMLAACDALAFTSVLFDFHRVLRVLILMRTTC